MKELNPTEPYWYWTYRYADNNELAVLVAKKAYDQNHPNIMAMDISKLIKGDRLIGVDVDRGFRPMGGSGAEEWKTWAAFELCPVIEVYYLDVDRSLAWRTLKI